MGCGTSWSKQQILKTQKLNPSHLAVQSHPYPLCPSRKSHRRERFGMFTTTCYILSQDTFGGTHIHSLRSCCGCCSEPIILSVILRFDPSPWHNQTIKRVSKNLCQFQVSSSFHRVYVKISWVRHGAKQCWYQSTNVCSCASAMPTSSGTHAAAVAVVLHPCLRRVRRDCHH